MFNWTLKYQDGPVVIYYKKLNNSYYFRAIVPDNDLDKFDAATCQKNCGYNPAGYDGPWPVSQSPSKDLYGHTIVEWACAGSCD